ncbi:MAG: hypothetical protein UY92_C0005G0003 [Candidatus Magasanikbacteria bacterium GW2011_GWA2_56_11]|uniref:Methyltransferase domain-containing protein n=1 Tax=Candidatus Magasanikbacteria bacterium GW2011_GWA2_56_11 TaxID=1619044 RepID=A0A0G1YH65_9BACT|nr:MAG: hypothetical protein UY92_C0005G0003 [Candidatus Magasanikbacteria bacterium GW2011_GWA2_56_11]
MSYHSGNNLVDPAALFAQARLQPGMHIADFGAGRTGHLVFPAGLIIGEHGVVYAVDILKDVLESVRKRAELEGYVNIHTVWADIEQTGKVAIPPRSLDAVFMVNVLFHASDPTLPLSEAGRLLKPKGRIVVVDWVKPLAHLGPAAGQLLDFGALTAWARDNNFAVQDDLPLGPYSRCLVLFRHE